MVTATRKKLIAADLFCGAGGFTTGAEQSGYVKVALAINHWRTAVFTHQDNHPGTKHLCARLEHVNPRHDTAVPALDLIMASPECTHHSIARGGRPMNDQTRQQPFALLDWLEAKMPKWLVVENVREFREWGPINGHGRPDPRRKGQTFRAWIQAIESLGYQVDHQLLNAADFGAPTKRLRLFVIARRGQSRRDIPWPEPTHAGRWLPASGIIDWSIPCPSIFSRTRPLADKTLKRIELGLRKYVGQEAVPYLLACNHGGADDRSHALSEPMATLTTKTGHSLVVPFQLKAMGRCPGLTRGVDEPVPTIVTRPNHSLVVAFLTKFYGTGRTQPVTEPLDTITTKHRFGLAMASLVQTMRELQVVDIGFRMLEPAELARAQGFPQGYLLHGNKADQVRQVGNAVCPPVAEAICRAIGQAA